MDLTYIAAYKKDIGTIPIVAGQLIFLRDADMCFYDMTHKTADDSTEVVRRSISGQAIVDKLPADGRPGVLYLLHNDSDTGIYGWDDENSTFICLASPNVDTKVTTTPDTTSTKIYITGTTSSKKVTGQLNIDTDVYFDATTGKIHAKGLEGKASKAGHSDTATKASQDGKGQDIAANYIKDVAISGTKVTITKGDGSTSQLSTQDNDTHYVTGSVVTNTPTSTQNSIAANANVYLVVMDDNKIRSAHKIVGQGATSVTSNGEGDIQIASTNTEYNDLVGATTTKPGTHGLVPAPDAGDATRYLRSDGTWVVPPNTEYTEATASVSGLLSAHDKAKLDTISRDADSVTLTRALGTGTKIATVTINGEDFDLYCDTNTHYESHLYAGEYQGKVNAITQVYDPYLLSVEDGELRSQVRLKGGSNMRVSAKDGIITFDCNNTEYSDVGENTSGLMSPADKQKLDSITDSADAVTFTPQLNSGSEIGVLNINGVNYTLYCEKNTDTTYEEMAGSTTSTDGQAGLVPAPAKGVAGRYLRADGVWAVPPNDNTSYSQFVGATDEDGGSEGLVPGPQAGEQNLFLRGDGQWSALTEATQSQPGVISAADKIKLDNLTTSLAKCVTDANTYTDNAVAALVGEAPATLDTIEELAAAFKDNDSVVDALNSAITNKVDKVAGKGLSTNDFTTAEKNKLASLSTGTNVSFTPSLTSGTKVGTLTIDGTDHTLYAPSEYSSSGSGVFGQTSYFEATSKTFLVSPGDILMVTYVGSGGGTALIMIHSESTFSYMSMLGTHSSSTSPVSTMSLINQSGTYATASLEGGTLTIGKSGGLHAVHVAWLHIT